MKYSKPKAKWRPLAVYGINHRRQARVVERSTVEDLLYITQWPPANPAKIPCPDLSALDKHVARDDMTDVVQGRAYSIELYDDAACNGVTVVKALHRRDTRGSITSFFPQFNSTAF